MNYENQFVVPQMGSSFILPYVGAANTWIASMMVNLTGGLLNDLNHTGSGFYEYVITNKVELKFPLLVGIQCTSSIMFRQRSWHVARTPPLNAGDPNALLTANGWTYVPGSQAPLVPDSYTYLNVGGGANGNPSDFRKIVFDRTTYRDRGTVLQPNVMYPVTIKDLRSAWFHIVAATYSAAGVATAATDGFLQCTLLNNYRGTMESTIS